MTGADWQGYRVASWFGVIVTAVFGVVSAIFLTWVDAAIAAGFGLALALLLVGRWLPAALDLLTTLAVILNVGGWSLNLFDRIAIWDDVTHAETTLALALDATFLLYRPLLDVVRRHPWRLCVMIVATGLAVGAMWEVLEWSALVVFGDARSGQVLEDEIIDLIMDGLGAIVATPIGLWAFRGGAGSAAEVSQRRRAA